jgi:hypothetical protein
MSLIDEVNQNMSMSLPGSFSKHTTNEYDNVDISSVACSSIVSFGNKQSEEGEFEVLEIQEDKDDHTTELNSSLLSIKTAPNMR